MQKISTSYRKTIKKLYIFSLILFLIINSTKPVEIYPPHKYQNFKTKKATTNNTRFFQEKNELAYKKKLEKARKKEFKKIEKIMNILELIINKK